MIRMNDLIEIMQRIEMQHKAIAKHILNNGKEERYEKE